MHSRLDLSQQVRKMGEAAIRRSHTSRFARQILSEGRYGFSMNRFDKRVRTLAVGLATLAGFVDTIGFIKLGGFFVSFMSGNSTRLAVGLAQGSFQTAIAARLIITFVRGVIALQPVVGTGRTDRMEFRSVRIFANFRPVRVGLFAAKHPTKPYCP